MRKYRIEIKWAIIFSVVMILWMLGEKILGLHDEYIADHSFYTSFFAIVAIGIYLLALYDKRKNYHNGFMSWQEGFKVGSYPHSRNSHPLPFCTASHKPGHYPRILQEYHRIFHRSRRNEPGRGGVVL